VTYNDVKRQQFLSDLSNPLVPLHRLMRNPVPHGFKGVELLDAMFSPITTPPNRAVGAAQGPRPPADPVPVERAIWFIRVLGANEISAHRTRLQPSSQVAAAAPSPLPATPSSNNTTATAPPAPISSNAWYTQEFTNIFTSWMRLQLMQLALPAVNKGPAKQGAPKAAVGILGDEKARARWLAKWDYT
jgi:mediator of RNA polymerase II transcription subunit 12